MIRALLSRLFERWVRPEVMPEDPAAMLADRPTLYIIENGGLADLAALRLAAADKNLPLPDEPLAIGDGFRESRSWISSVQDSGRRRWRQSRRLQQQHKQFRELFEALLSDPASDLQVVPVAVYWGRAPGKEASFWQLVFSEDWEIAGRLRRLVKSILHGRNTLLSISEPVSLREFIWRDANADELEKKLLRLLRLHFRKRRMATLGPDQSHRRMLIDHVLADDAVRREIARQARESRHSEKRMRFKAERYAWEIAADMSYTTVRTLHRPLTRLWNELYDGVELDGMERLKRAADTHSLVYVPCHRSHIDYLLLSYILYTHGLSLPHIAAGVNLNLPVVGGILRRGGAFFLRRTFAGKPLYARVFNAYLTVILQRGNALEYFIEGGRSRTGLLLPPKPGMLAMTLHAYLRKPSRPIAFIPVYFGYERLLEGRAFTSELAGGRKRKESIFGLLRSLGTLREDYGHVYVNIGEPIELDTLLRQENDGWRQLPVTSERPAWIQPVVTRLGNTIMRSINAAACVTPISLLATTLLTTPRGRIARAEFIEEVLLYHRLLQASHDENSIVEVPDIDPEALIAHGIRLGYLEEQQDDIGTVLAIRPGQAAALTYFRNNILHLLCLPALLAAGFSNRRSRKRSELETLVRRVLPFLKVELFLPNTLGVDAIDESLQAMLDAGLLHVEGDSLASAAGGTLEAVSLMRLAELMMPTLRRDYLCASLIARAEQHRINREELAGFCEKVARRLENTQGWRAEDLYNKSQFKVFIDTLEREGYLQRDGDMLAATPAMQRVESEARSLLGEQVRHAILNAVARARSSHPEQARDRPGS
ncbi:MAG: glycerol-3-phosphate 1-O-acyltransferase [Gammaproteobacteria bacterium]|nr:MAG: glycerol-3-phosphate 1-O-acyltransferase [Gammaproteobacteria bacterium]